MWYKGKSKSKSKSSFLLNCLWLNQAVANVRKEGEEGVFIHLFIMYNTGCDSLVMFYNSLTYRSRLIE